MSKTKRLTRTRKPVKDVAAVRIALIGVWDALEIEVRRIRELLYEHSEDSQFWFVQNPLSELDGILDCLKHGRPVAPSRTFAELAATLKAAS